MHKMNNEKTLKRKLPVILYIIVAVIFMLPSVIYMIKNKTVYNFIYMFTYFFRTPTTTIEKLGNALMYFGLFSILFL